MSNIKSKIGLLLVAFICAYAVDGISQSEKSSKTEVVIIKKSIDDNGQETVEKSVFSGDDLSDEELEKLIEAKTAGEVEVNVWKTDEGQTLEISVDETAHMEFMEGDDLEDFLKEKGLSMDDIAEMNINVDTEIVDGKEKSVKTIVILDKEGKKHEYEMETEGIEAGKGHQIRIRKDHKPRLGVVIKDTEEGLLIEEVIDGSPAHKAGLLVGDIITSVGETWLESMDDFLTALEKSGKRNAISYIRDGKNSFVPVVFEDFEYKGATKEKTRTKMIIKTEDR